MTNEELVTLIQAGERDRLPELWERVERFVARQANRLLIVMGDSAAAHGLEFDDLYNSGYLALVSAVKLYDPEAGMRFIGLLALCLKTAFAEAGGWRTSKRDPLNRAASMDAPIGDDKDGDSKAFGDFIPDPAAAQAFQDVEERLYQEQLHAALERALGTLEADEEATIRARYYQGQTLDEIAAAEGVYKETVRQWQEKGLRALRRYRVRHKLNQFVENRTPYFANWGARTGERTTEMIVLKREQLEMTK